MVYPEVSLIMIVFVLVDRYWAVVEELMGIYPLVVEVLMVTFLVVVVVVVVERLEKTCCLLSLEILEH